MSYNALYTTNEAHLLLYYLEMWTQWLNIYYNSAKNAGNINHHSFYFPYGRRKKYAESSQEPFGQIPILFFFRRKFLFIMKMDFT